MMKKIRFRIHDQDGETEVFDTFYEALEHNTMGFITEFWPGGHKVWNLDELRFECTLSPDDVNALGEDWRKRIDDVIDNVIASSTGVTAVSRIAGIMSEVPMSAQDITDVINAMYGPKTIGLSYTRLCIANMVKTGQMKRHSHGKYVK